MQELKTQQFAKFYIKDIKTKLEKNFDKKNTLEEFKISSSS